MSCYCSKHDSDFVPHRIFVVNIGNIVKTLVDSWFYRQEPHTVAFLSLVYPPWTSSRFRKEARIPDSNENRLQLRIDKYRDWEMDVCGTYVFNGHFIDRQKTHMKFNWSLTPGEFILLDVPDTYPATIGGELQQNVKMPEKKITKITLLEYRVGTTPNAKPFWFWPYQYKNKWS